MTDAAPTVATPAAASPGTVTGTTATLSALGADTQGAAGLTYTWAAVGTPPAPVTFSANGTNGAKTTAATFTKVGTYTLRVTIADGAGQTVTSDVAVTVAPVLSSVAITPGSAVLVADGTRAFTAFARDQFGTALVTQPAVTWSLATGSVGTVSATGVYTAPAAGSGTAPSGRRPTA